MSVLLQGGSRDGIPLPPNPHGADTWNYADLNTGMVERYSATTGQYLGADPMVGGPFADYEPDRNTWWQVTRAERVRASILRSLPSGRPGRFVRCTSGGDQG